MSRLAQLQRLLAADPNDAFVLYAMAQEHLKAGEHARAIDHLDRCLAADPNHGYAYFFKARALSAMGDAPGARAAVEAGLAAAGRTGDGKAANELAGLLAELG